MISGSLRMRMACRAAVFALVLTFGCGGKDERSAPAREAAEGQVIHAGLVQYYQDMSDRAWERYRDHFWQNATITTAWQRPGEPVERVHVITIDDFIRETPNGPDSKPIFQERMSSSDVKVAGNLAVAWARYEAKFGTADSLLEWKGTDLFTLMKHDGQWKIVSLVFESDR